MQWLFTHGSLARTRVLHVVFTLVGSRLLEMRLQALAIPNSPPVDGPVGSGSGFRRDPITGLAALHTGLDFPAERGIAIEAAAGGFVVASEWHPVYAAGRRAAGSAAVFVGRPAAGRGAPAAPLTARGLPRSRRGGW